MVNALGNKLCDDNLVPARPPGGGAISSSSCSAAGRRGGGVTCIGHEEAAVGGETGVERKPRQQERPAREVQEWGGDDLRGSSGSRWRQRYKRDLAIPCVQEGPPGAVRMRHHGQVAGGGAAAGESLEANGIVLGLRCRARRRGRRRGAPGWEDGAAGGGVHRLGEERGYASLQRVECRG